MKRVALLLCCMLGCGGKAHGSDDGGLSGSGGSSAGASSGPTPTPGGAAATPDGGGAIALGGGVAAAEGGETSNVPVLACPHPVASCGIERSSYVSIEDGTTAFSLSFPLDLGCASCRVTCEDCETTCEVSATGDAFCDLVRLSVAVCAGPNHEPPCLDTVTDDPYYLDRDGKTWSVIALSGFAPTSTFPSVVEGDLTLGLRDGAATRELPTHVRVCASLTPTAPPCK